MNLAENRSERSHAHGRRHERRTATRSWPGHIGHVSGAALVEHASDIQRRAASRTGRSVAAVAGGLTRRNGSVRWRTRRDPRGLDPHWFVAQRGEVAGLAHMSSSRTFTASSRQSATSSEGGHRGELVHPLVEVYLWSPLNRAVCPSRAATCTDGRPCGGGREAPGTLTNVNPQRSSLRPSLRRAIRSVG